jgi:hypothetical protein
VAYFKVLYRHLLVYNLSASARNRTGHVQNYLSRVIAELVIRSVFCLAALRQGMKREEGANVSPGIS